VVKFFYRELHASDVPISLAYTSFSYYICTMTITQTVEIPADRRITLEVPREVPTGQVILTFTPAHTVNPFAKTVEKSEERDIELFKLHAERLNAEALDVLSYQDEL